MATGCRSAAIRLRRMEGCRRALCAWRQAAAFITSCDSRTGRPGNFEALLGCGQHVDLAGERIRLDARTLVVECVEQRDALAVPHVTKVNGLLRTLQNVPCQDG